MKALKDCRVLVTPTSFGMQDPSLKTDLENQVSEVIYNTTGKALQSHQLQKLLPGMDGLIAGLDEIDRSALQAGGDLKIVARYGVGINNVDLAAAKELGIVVTNTPGANAGAVAEHTVALMLNLLRGILPAVEATKRGEWPRVKGYSLEGKIVGIMGCGAIGQETAKRLAGFGCQVLACDECPDPEFAAANRVEYGPLEEVLLRADLITLHLPLTSETEGLVNQEFLNKMKPGSWLINTARGELINEGDLLAALETGQLRGAGLDVYAQEPPDPESPLLQHSGVIATPHMAAHADSATNAMGRLAVRECLAVLQGNEPRFQVN